MESRFIWKKSKKSMELGNGYFVKRWVILNEESWKKIKRESLHYYDKFIILYFMNANIIE